MAVFDPQARLALRDTHVLCLEVQEPWAAALVRGTKTIETRRYALPAWARGVDVVVLETPRGAANASSLGESPAAAAGTLVGVVVFGDSVRYGDEARWRQDEPFHRVAAGSPYDWDGGEKHGWVVASARAVAPLPSPPLVRKFRSFYEPVAGATPTARRRAPVVAAAAGPPSSRWRRSGAGRRCPDAMFAATLKFGSGVFTAADKVSTKPIPREDLLRGFLCHGEASGEPLMSGRPLRLAHPDGVAVQCGPAAATRPRTSRTSCASSCAVNSGVR
ncbi:phosphatase [Aureococcus anophagefferens]|uniref:Phosphatase n=1 Tax=Aureococcus anophagefferens TaxID=44056 RepID=A0ABR1FTF6_AURAN